MQHKLDTSFLNILVQMEQAEVTSALRGAVYDAAKLPRDAYGVLAPRKSGKTAGSIGIRVKVFPNGGGVYAVIGEKVVAGKIVSTAFYALEAGTPPRFRQRIGGKYDWVEVNLINMPDAIKRYKRRTGQVEARHYLKRAYDQTLPQALAVMASTFKNKILVKWMDNRVRG